jgi:hypothetical protein
VSQSAIAIENIPGVAFFRRREYWHGIKGHCGTAWREPQYQAELRLVGSHLRGDRRPSTVRSEI